MSAEQAIAGWFTQDGQAALVGGKCQGCGTFTFPHRDGRCPNPACVSQDMDAVELSTRGKVWSYATNHYAPPPPALVAAPYTVVAVTLEAEQLTVLGLLAQDADVDQVRVGSEVELTIEAIATGDDLSPDAGKTVWKWRPVASAEVTS